MTNPISAYQKVARDQSLDALAIVPGANFSRIFNKEFHQNERPLVVFIPAEGPPAAIVPNLELGSFSAIQFDGEIYDWRDQTGYQAAFDNLLSKQSFNRIGVEGQVMRVFVHHAIKRALPDAELVDAQVPIAALRLCKTDEEIASMRRAIAISETALTETIDQLRVGMTETQIESTLVQRLLANGASEMAFPPIVAAADNSAKPHASAREDYAIKAGDALLFDFGARYNGVCADITRTFFVQHCDERKQAIYETVLKANLAGIAASKPGATAHEIDDAATVVLETSAYDDRIRHKTGHGLGRDIHEDPYIMRGNQQPLETGMVFTVEPGLYQAGDFGVRIEDDVLITDTGAESLTTFSKQLQLVAT